jgi:membrane fusion protein (multidrug efflux system)
MIVAGVLLYVRHIRLNITTDDAYVTGHVHAIASRVAGTVSAVHVQDNQLVKAGDLLVEIDSRDYDVKVRDSQASVETETSKLSEMSVRVDVAERQLDEIRTRIDTARAALALQEANLRQAGQDLARARTLHEKGVFAEATLKRPRQPMTSPGPRWTLPGSRSSRPWPHRRPRNSS